jgi:hypothetical protein
MRAERHDFLQLLELAILMEDRAACARRSSDCGPSGSPPAK